MFSKVKYAVFLQKRHRISFILNGFFINVFIFFAINIFTSIYIDNYPDVKIKQPVGKLSDFGFSISPFYGGVYTLLYAIGFFSLMTCCIQRLRDMGYRYPIAISLMLTLLILISDFLSDTVGINFISIVIDIGVFVFIIMMLFTAPKLSASDQ